MSTSPEEYHAGSDDESPETGTAYNRTTGEPETTPHDLELAEQDAEAGNPNAASSAGLEGDMGVSSERTGPADETGTAGLGDLDRVDTRAVGTARGRTHGSTPTTGGSRQDLRGAPGAEPEEDRKPSPEDLARPKRTVGETNPAEVPSHKLSNKNPGHSGGTPGQTSE